MSKQLLLTVFFVVLSLNSLSPVADIIDIADIGKPCQQLSGKYSFDFEGTSFNPPPLGTVPFTETGVLKIKKNGEMNGKSDTAFQFVDFSGMGPLWLLVREVQTFGKFTSDSDFTCFGVVNFLATGTVLKSSNPVIMPEGTILYSDLPRSLSYAVSGNDNQYIKFIFTSMGMIASGAAHKQQFDLSDFEPGLPFPGQ